MPSDNGVGKPGVKATPRRPEPQGRARAGQGWGHARGRWPITLAWGSWQLLADSSCSCWTRDWSWATGQALLCRRRQEPWGAGVELSPRKEGWCGEKVGGYNTNIQVTAVEGKEGVSGGI